MLSFCFPCLLTLNGKLKYQTNTLVVYGIYVWLATVFPIDFCISINIQITRTIIKLPQIVIHIHVAPRNRRNKGNTNNFSCKKDERLLPNKRSVLKQQNLVYAIHGIFKLICSVSFSWWRWFDCNGWHRRSVLVRHVNNKNVTKNEYQKYTQKPPMLNKEKMWKQKDESESFYSLLSIVHTQFTNDKRKRATQYKNCVKIYILISTDN